METKLTLRIDEKISESAKLHARKQGTRLSRLVADYLQVISSKKASASSFKPTPVLSEITGVLQNAHGKTNVREAYDRYLEEKYL